MRIVAGCRSGRPPCIHQERDNSINPINKEDLIPQKCIDRNCPRKSIDGKGTDVCILYQVNEKKELAVLDVFNVSEKQCKQLRASAQELLREGGAE